MPVGPNSSAEYIIEWKPIIWSGFIPFTFQSGESRIKYQYEHLVFGEVVEINDKTAEHCGVDSVSDTSEIPTSETTDNDEVIPLPTATHTPFPPSPTQPPINEVPVWSFEEEGVRVNINASGVYNVAYLGDAYSPWADEQDEGYRGWTTILRIYINRPVEWGTTEYGLVGPINHDDYLGPGGYYLDKAEAIALSKGDSRNFRLNIGDYLTVVTLDEKGRYADNRGKMDVGITYLGQ